MRKMFKTLMMAAAIVLPTQWANAITVEFDMLNPDYSGFSGPEGYDYGLNQSVGGRDGVATLLSGGSYAGGIWENAWSLGLYGSQLKDIEGFSFDYYIHDGYSMSGGARLTTYIYADPDMVTLLGFMHIDNFQLLDQTTEQWITVDNLLTSPAGAAKYDGGYQSWDQIVANYGNLYWGWMGIIQDNPGPVNNDGVASIFSVDNLAVTTVSEVPEPGVLGLLAIGALALFGRRRFAKC